MTHHATEDLAIMRALPGITVIAPGDDSEAAAAALVAYQTPGPFYLRLGRGGEPRIHESVDLKFGKAIEIKLGDRAAIISTGGILSNALIATQILESQGYKVGLYSMPFIKPLDIFLIRYLATRMDLIVTVEEHNLVGGLTGAVSEQLARLSNPRARLKGIGINDVFTSTVGSQEYLREIYGLSAQAIASAVVFELSES